MLSSWKKSSLIADAQMYQRDNFSHDCPAKEVKNNLKSGFQAIRIYLLNSYKFMNGLQKKILEEILGSMTENLMEVFVEELN